MRRWLATAAGLCCLSFGATPVQELMRALPQEAADFSRCAPRLHSKETITHRALSGKSQPRTLISDYAFVQMNDSSAAVREVRQMRELDGKPLKAAGSLDAIAQAFADGSEKQKRRQLQQFEKLGIHGAAADLGQMLLMFAAASLPGYEFRFAGEDKSAAGVAVLTFAFAPIDSPDKGVLIFQAGRDRAQKPRYKGIVWLRKQDSRLAKIAIDSEAIGGQRQRLIVDYEPSDACPCVMPVAASHRELAANGAILVENVYVYERFRPLGENK